ncbi:MAG: alginate export family protein, partial [Pseudomonadota bacterium]
MRVNIVSRLIWKFQTLLFSIPAVLLFASGSLAETKFDYGADFRLRYEYWKGTFDMSTLGLDDENYLRLKVSLWSRLQLNKKLAAYLKLSTEPKCYISSSNTDNKDLEQDEVFFESLYVDVKDAAGIPLDLRIGRQDLRYGDGFLIADGTPVSADRTKYFNAAKATWKITGNNSLDLLYI